MYTKNVASMQKNKETENNIIGDEEKLEKERTIKKFSCNEIKLAQKVGFLISCLRY